MPKITGTGTPSNSGVPVPPQSFDQGKFFNQEKFHDLRAHSRRDGPEPVTVDDDGTVVFLPPDEEEVSPSVGNSSLASNVSKPTTPGKPTATGAHRRPARTTGNRSK